MFFQKLLSIFLRKKIPEKQNVQYGFNRINTQENVENSCSDEEKYAYFQRTNLDKILDREKLNILSSQHSDTVLKFLHTNYNKQQKKLDPNFSERFDAKKKSLAEKPKPNAAKTNGIFNWFSKYPEVFSQINEFENPAMILDEDESLRHKIREKNELAQHANYTSQLHDKNFNNQDISEESFTDLNDTLALRSASQVPVNLPFSNPSYLYEEQEGSVDLRSECSFLAKNNSFLNNNISKTKNSKTPQSNCKNLKT